MSFVKALRNARSSSYPTRAAITPIGSVVARNNPAAASSRSLRKKLAGGSPVAATNRRPSVRAVAESTGR